MLFLTTMHTFLRIIARFEQILDNSVCAGPRALDIQLWIFPVKYKNQQPSKHNKNNNTRARSSLPKNTLFGIHSHLSFASGAPPILAAILKL
jgi:hypothetical protein